MSTRSHAGRARLLTALATAFTAGLALTATRADAQTKKSAPARKTAAAAAAPRRFVLAADGNEARYRVRERLMGHDLDNDAIGTTKEITGRLFVDAQGRVVRDSSRIVVTLTNLTSDQARRDGFVKRRTLQVDSFPTATLVPTEFRGGTGTLPTSGTATFELLADLTVRGVTRPTVWKVTARAEGGAVTGTATTAFTFKDFSLDQPRVPVLLSVADTITLEYDFRFVPETAPAIAAPGQGR
ncbi:YceI family protein (plasmid) [Gemmatirosa kalamazoonensis]|uniref:YceI family protein n=1 Tax=Gemmatirosa kalamazoonensis TaxID=861299 RepID=W0RPK7_9BACT|nr:YceI family protein [Gemmatirosa kalamazoonensis]AHG92656.1 YceI family protein [Gemmatirosa kalamazoonensis]